MSTLKVDGIRSNSASSDAITLASDGTCTANITNNLSNRNKIINGAMQVAQRGTSQTGVNSSGYKTVCDRWRFNASGSNVGTYTVSQSSTSPDGFGASLKVDCTTARTPASNELYEVEQRFEGQNLQGFAKGTSAAKKFSVSFYVKSNVSGNYVVWLYDADNSRNIGAVYTVSDSNWNRYTVSFPADTTGAFGNDNARSLDLRFVLLAGTDFTSGTLPTAAWEGTSNANSRAGQTANVASSTSNEWYLTGVQLEVGSVATDFEHRSFSDELARCQRYYIKNAGGSDVYCFAAKGQGSSSCDVGIPVPVAMRASPSVTCTLSRFFRSTTADYTETSSSPSVAQYDSAINSFVIALNVGGISCTNNEAGAWTPKAASLTLDAEL